MSDTNRILAAVDKSESAMDIAEYLTGVVKPGQAVITLYHVRRKSPWKSWSLKKDAANMNQVMNSLESWESRESREAEKLLDRIGNVFLEKGFSEESVEKKIDAGAESVVNNILTEAAKGYKALVLGRSGESPVRDLLLGTTASKLLGKLANVPMWVVGKPRHPGRKVIIAMDDGEASLQAVEHVALALGGTDAEVTLMHIVENSQSFNPVVNGYLPEGFEESWIADVKKAMDAAMGKASDILQRAGFKVESIKRVMLQNEPSRAGGIVEYAKDEGFGTIVVGQKQHDGRGGAPAGPGEQQAGAYGQGLRRVGGELGRAARPPAEWIGEP